ncbi:MAG: M48 family metalloprotease, partial [Burkholderiales bacterium]|nr:M48 family metalloprotease [Burkholderiales bacterium]
MNNLKKYIELLYKSRTKTTQEQLNIVQDISRRGFLHQIIDISLFGMMANTCCSLPSDYSKFLPDMGDSDRLNLSPIDATFLGKKIIDSIANKDDMLVDYDLIAYLNLIGENLTSYSPLASTQIFNFYALRSKEINAFALPGGYICIYNGLIYTTQSEAELAGVMSHEIGHIVQHHIFRNISVYNRNQWLILAGIIAGAILAPINPGAAVMAANGGQGLAIQNILAFSRDFEREADRVGQNLMYNAGFNAHAMPSFFARLQNADKFNSNDALAFLQTHPVTIERLSEAQLRANQLPVKMRLDSKIFLMIREKCRVRQMGITQVINFYQQSLKKKRYSDINTLYYGYAFACLGNSTPLNTLAYLNKIHEPTITNHPAFYSLKALAYAKTGKINDAQKIYEQALSLFPNYKGLWIGRVDVVISAKQFKLAGAYLSSLSDQYPNDIDIWS